MFDIAIIINISADTQYVAHAPYLLIADYYVSIIGVVFATRKRSCPSSNPYMFADALP